jgi:hypothetical protein
LDEICLGFSLIEIGFSAWLRAAQFQIRLFQKLRPANESITNSSIHVDTGPYRLIYKPKKKKKERPDDPIQIH